MKLELFVTNLGLSKKLEKYGVKQKSLFQWGEFLNDEFRLYPTWFPEKNWRQSHEVERLAYSAFTSGELGNLLPNTYQETRFLTSFRCSRSGWWVEYDDGHGKKSDFSTWAQTEADARAKMLIRLLANNLIIAEEINKKLGETE